MVKSDEPIYATAVPIPDTHDMRSTLQRDASSYSLPSGNREQEINQNTVQRLRDQGYTIGLAKSLSTNKTVFPLRIWVVDNSGSMQKADGNRIIETRDRSVKFAQCTRWNELKACVNYHVQMAALLEAPTIFRFLNDPGAAVGTQQFSIAEASDSPIDIMNDKQKAQSIMNKARPGGVTPLVSHILEIQQSVTNMAPDLMRKGQRVAIIIATDGVPTDDRGYQNEDTRRQFIDSLRLLEGLPVWVVVRLCTDDEEVVEFYNELDEELELSLEVLDDFSGEAKEVYTFNPWLNYTLPLHRCREMGYYDRLFDLLDERKFTKEELRDFFALLFGEANFDGVPDPAVDWEAFKDSVSKLVNMEEKQWHPMKNQMLPWVDMKKLEKEYNDSKPKKDCVLM